MTAHLADTVIRLCKVLPVQHVATWYGLDWDTVKALDKAALAARLLPVDLSDVKAIAMDEFALRKGHRYACGVGQLWDPQASPRARLAGSPSTL
jgi:transposase